MEDFRGKVAFITGGASGIGFALGRALSDASAKIMLADIEAAALDDALSQLGATEDSVQGVVCDVADPGSVEQAAEATLSAFGKVHILCNNAGVGAASSI
ncbi:MAG TPA: SDR family NAD(P)-dependent oxidoreductase, partial [Stellaceae bacterium]|nr:SDR family NAD(P)-dependent oxidoreductase [Stellaceae bacterium]